MPSINQVVDRCALTRMAWSPDGRRLCVGDAKVCDVSVMSEVDSTIIGVFRLLRGHTRPTRIILLRVIHLIWVAQLGESLGVVADRIHLWGTCHSFTPRPMATFDTSDWYGCTAVVGACRTKYACLEVHMPFDAHTSQ